jgi:hypothetical protein
LYGGVSHERCGSNFPGSTMACVLTYTVPYISKSPILYSPFSIVPAREWRASHYLYPINNSIRVHGRKECYTPHSVPLLTPDTPALAIDPSYIDTTDI